MGSHLDTVVAYCPKYLATRHDTKSTRKSLQEGHITLIELARMFPDEESARQWFEGILWPCGNRHCPRCGSHNTHECSHAKMPYRCRDCRKYFSVKTGTAMGNSPIPLMKWVYAIYLDTTSLKGVSSMKLHRDLGVTQKTAWHMRQRIREAFAAQGPTVRFEGPVEVDENFFGGGESNKREHKKLRAGRGTVGKTAVVGAKDRDTNKVAAKVVESTDKATLQGFVANHSAVRHSVGEYVSGHVHTNGIESFSSMLKRAHKGTFHKLSPKHLQRYVDEFAGRHTIRELDTIEQMSVVTGGLMRRFPPCRTLVRNNGLSAEAQG